MSGDLSNVVSGAAVSGKCLVSLKNRKVGGDCTGSVVMIVNNVEFTSGLKYHMAGNF